MPDAALSVTALADADPQEEPGIPAASASGMALPLCVDLDGTLLRTDLLVESALALLKQQPWTIFFFPLWLLAGKAVLKRRIAERVSLDPASLPYREDLVSWLREEHARGRPLVLATASDASLAEPVSAHLGLFSRVLGSDGATNLSGPRKAELLVREYGERGFAYAGNSRTDLAVWARAAEGVAVDAPASLQRSARAVTRLARVFPVAGGGLKPLVEALRPHQWVKNALVFLPLVTAHRADLGLLGQAVLAFVAFSFCASSVYVLNDLLDLESDRHHPRKRQRPFASGRLSVFRGLLLAPALLAAGIAVGQSLGGEFLAILGFYFFLTLAYSVQLKQLAIADVLVLAGLYTLRIFAGASATSVPLSDWLLAFSLFFFLSLALVKRTSELEMLVERQENSTRGRGYLVGDRETVASLGAASGYLAVLVLALYVNGADVQRLYEHPRRLWLLCPAVLYWISRVWLLARRGRMHDDPVVFALRDRVSYVVGALCLAIMLSAL